MNEQNNNKPKNPNPNKSVQPRNPRPVNNKSAPTKPANQKSGPVRNARAADEFQPGRTAVFDSVSNDKNAGRPDGTYHYTARDIKSSRQKFVSSDENISVRRKSRDRASDDDITEMRGGGVISGIFKAILYILGVAAVSGILGYNIVSMTNDVFAFLKDEIVVEITLPQDADIDSISRILADNKLIKYPNIFKLYASLRGRNKQWEFRGGETFVVSAVMPYDEFISEFRVKGAARQEVRLAFPEGWTIDQIIDRLTENGVGLRSNYEYIINNHEFTEYEFLEPLYDLERDPDRIYLLEGYMFPDTYDFYTNESEFDVIRKFLNNFRVKFNVRSFERLDILGMTLDELINLASIIQRESLVPGDFGKISQVFHNRLLNPALFPRLQSDATILYDKNIFPEHRLVTPADLEHDVPYNTYERDGLPPSAICNPGRDAIHAALEPDEDYIGYYYFVSMPDGTNLYGRTLAEHNINIEESRIAWDALGN